MAGALGRLKRFFYREPVFYIGGKDNPYIRRWWVIPRNRFFNIYLHNMLRDDDDRALHDHPWFNISVILKGGYIEHAPVCPRLYPHDHRVKKKIRKAGHIVFRRPRFAHRLELIPVNYFSAYFGSDIDNRLSSWSLFITGPKVRDWGFWCPSTKGWRWVPWQEFTDPTDYGKTGKGCAE